MTGRAVDMWFETLTGFAEQSPQQVRERLAVRGCEITSLVNGATYIFGRLETPSVQDLRTRVVARAQAAGQLRVREVVADVQDLHVDAANAGALFQVASQFNLLEMVSPQATPELGVGIYENDHTQGPACAIAAGAGTIYRNYFAPVPLAHGEAQIGQSEANQIDGLADLGHLWGNDDGHLWVMTNGYALASEAGLLEISQRIQHASEAELDLWRAALRIGLQWDTQVTLQGAKHLVTQAYAAALPVAYSPFGANQWEPFAALVLEAAYEATILAAILNAEVSGNPTVYLTLLGGGAFGNDQAWIVAALKRALDGYRDYALDVAIVSFAGPQPSVQELLD
jgi:hypothetical protein